MKNETAVRRELAKVQSPLIELREWRVALANQTVRMTEQKKILEEHRLSRKGAHGVFGLKK